MLFCLEIVQYFVHIGVSQKLQAFHNMFQPNTSNTFTVFNVLGDYLDRGH